MNLLEDRFAILDTIAAYSYCYDGQDADGFAALFTEDGLWEAWGPGATTPEVRLPSRDAIREWVSARLAKRVGKFSSRHHQSSTVFESLKTDSARTRTMILVTHQGVEDPAPTPTLSGYYLDTWRKTAQGWKFAHRELRHDRHAAHVQG